MGEQTVVTVVPNWNLRTDLAQCLDSLAQSTYRDHKIIVVDNNSSDDSVAYVRGHYPDVTVVAFPENRGYASALNAGVACGLSSGAGYVFALNNDTVVPPQTISNLVQVLRADAKTGVVAPKILSYSEPDRLWSLGDRKSPWLPLPRSYGNGWRDGPEFGGLMEFDYVTGCAMLIPCSVFRDVGLFDESLFLFYEDSDFCRRVCDRGYRILCVGNTPIYHKASASTGGNNAPATLRVRARNRIRFYRRYRHGPSPALTMLAIAFMAVWRILGYAVKRPQLVGPYIGGLLSGLREPLTAPEYPWPAPPCPAEPVLVTDRAAHGA